MVTEVIGTAAAGASSFRVNRARSIGPAQRKELSVEVLARSGPVKGLAALHGVSRKFLYQQGRKASEALDEAFSPVEDQDAVMYWLPVTKRWMRQFVLCAALEGHSSFRGIQQMALDLFDYHDMSLGTIHNIVQEAIGKARVVSRAQDLAEVRVGVHDEIYQADRPVLVGADVKSTYCYLLSEEDSDDQTAWGVHLLDLERQGLRPDYTVADCGKGLRTGQAAAWGDVPCHGDVFHAQKTLGELAFYLERRASGCTSTRQKLQRRLERRKKHGRQKCLRRKLAAAREAELAAVPLAQEVRILSDWMQKDILSLAGPSLAVRRELFNFVLKELARRVKLCPHRIRPVLRALGQQRDNLLAFAGVLEDNFADLAEQYEIPPVLVQQLCQLEALDINSPAYWQYHGPLLAKLGVKFRPLQQAVRTAMADTPRSSSIVENINSRLRTYFFLRKELGHGYLDLLQFFLNHHQLQRSRRPQRTGHSPAELLNGKAHPHWLELLGFQRFHRN